MIVLLFFAKSTFNAKAYIQKYGIRLLIEQGKIGHL